MEKPAHQEIARRAYEMWERGGWLHGHDLEHWFTAERQLMGAATVVVEGRPVGEIRLLEHQAAAQPAKPVKAAKSPATAKAAKTGAERMSSAELGAKLDALQSTLAAKEASSAKSDAKPRAKKAAGASNGAAAPKPNGL